MKDFVEDFAWYVAFVVFGLSALVVLWLALEGIRDAWEDRR